MKTKESIKAYNKEYFSRPEVIARAKIRNAQYRKRRQEYKKTEKGKIAEKRYRTKPETRKLKEWERIKRRYGMTKIEFDKMFELQNGCCAICHQEQKTRLHIDNDHITGKVRGLLCFNCNGGLGQFKDSIDLLSKAITYLNK